MRRGGTRSGGDLLTFIAVGNQSAKRTRERRDIVGFY